PRGKTNHASYRRGSTDNRLHPNLTGITDPTGQVWLQVVYRPSTDPTSVDFDTVDYLQREVYRDCKRRRVAQIPSPQNAFAVVKCIENDAVGNVTECFYDSQNRCVRQLEYTGRANPDQPTNEKQNRPVNKLRSTNPGYYETRCQWN